MKHRTLTLLFAAAIILSIFTGCSASIQQIDTSSPSELAPAVLPAPVSDSNRAIHEESLKIYSIDPDAPIAEIPDVSVPLASEPSESLSKRHAESIAIYKAGLDSDDVRYLYTKYDIDDGIPVYEVNFHAGEFEYEISVHAETGEIVSLEKESID